MNVIRHILLAVDFDAASERAIDAAVTLARQLGAQVTLAHAIDASRGILADASLMVELLAEERAAAMCMLGERATALRKLDVRCGTMLLEGPPAEQIVAAADKLGVDLVMVGSHARRGVAHALMGSVAEQVVRTSSIPVLAVPGFWFADRTEAGRDLGEALDALHASSPVLVAISPGSVLVAAEAADLLHARLDILRPKAQRALVAQGRTLREVPIRDVERRTVVVVSDELMDARCALLAVDLLERMGPREIRIATPIASAAAVAALRTRVSEITVLRVVDLPVPDDAIYRVPSKTSDEALAEILAERAA